MTDVSSIFGSMVFNDAVMQARLPKETYRALCRTIDEGRSLDVQVAAVVANAMKDWAIEKGATHYTHWFQPLTGITAEKHDAFITPAKGGRILQELSGKELVLGESDASSFPSGGLRATFEARGYTAWDPTSYAFIKDYTLYIPTAFCSYGGEALDQKTPLLRSMEALNRQALRILHLFGNDCKRVSPTVGAEQEYFLIDKSLFDCRKDLIFTGRTLFGAKPPKGQEMGDHYFGTLSPRVQAFMRNLDEELWKLGVLAKTEHNEVAPGQHEMAPIFAANNEAADHNQLTMELMKKLAPRHGLACLLSEKPFAGLNGSGKHNNWSLSTDTGANLLDPGETPFENAQFLLFLAAVIQAVDDYQDLLRASVASAGNDHRLGANEAPPAIVSVFLGDELTDIIHSIMEGRTYTGHEKDILTVGVHVLPKFPKDTTDRNRTSPFAFTGNKFEFRMVGSNSSISEPNIVINTIVAESLAQYADVLEKAQDLPAALHELLKDVFTRHERILFNGNNYSSQWVKEAEARGLGNRISTVDALPCLLLEKNVQLFGRHFVFTPAEIRSRYEIHLESYVKTINIEALTALDMARREILPAVIAYKQRLLNAILATRQALGQDTPCPEEKTAQRINTLLVSLINKTDALDELLPGINGQNDNFVRAIYCRDQVIPAMAGLRMCADELETLVGSSYWPFPTYSQLLFSV